MMKMASCESKNAVKDFNNERTEIIDGKFVFDLVLHLSFLFVSLSPVGTCKPYDCFVVYMPATNSKNLNERKTLFIVTKLILSVVIFCIYYK